jgi:hypothetical protein
MRRLTLLAGVVLLCGVAQVNANGGRPPLIPVGPGVMLGSRNVEITVEVDEKAKDTRLVIPSNVLVMPQPLPGKLGADAGGLPPIVTGVALTCAFVSGGMWLVRRGRGRLLGGLLIAGLLVAGTSMVSANFGPIKPKPPVVKENTVPVQLPANVQITGKLVLEIVPNGDKIRLIVPKTAVPKGEKIEKPEEK